MIDDSNIMDNLIALDEHYQGSSNLQDANFASKLAILELCGWIEEVMDGCIQGASMKFLKDVESHKFIEETIKRNSGFLYKEHFRSMMVNLVGIVGVERINQKIDNAIIDEFSSELNTLYTMRNRFAHTYTSGVTAPYDAPSTTIGRLAKIKPGLEAYDTVLRRYRP